MIKKDIFSLLFIKICLIYVKVSHVQLFATPWAVHSPWNSPDQNTGVGSCSLLTMYKFKICGCEWDPQSCLTLCDPMDCSSPGSSVHGILWARILERAAMSFSNVCINIYIFSLSDFSPVCNRLWVHPPHQGWLKCVLLYGCVIVHGACGPQGSLYFHPPNPSLSYSLPHPLCQLLVCSLYLPVCLFCYGCSFALSFFPHVSEIIQYLSFSFLLHLE